jgi:hypothetical protein
VALGVPGLVSAQTGTPTTTTTTAPASGAPAKPDRAARLAEILAPLVKDGTITQEQADKVIAALQQAEPVERHGRGGKFGGASLDAAAQALGVTTAELRQALRDGKTIADVAKEKNVELQKVIDAVVADATTRLNQAVTDGKLTRAQADARIAQLQEQATKLVNGQLPARGPGGRGKHGGAPGDDAPTSTTTTTPSS